MTTNRVRLTPAAATRFPDLAGRTGTVGTASLNAGKQVSVLIHWHGDHEPRETWLPVTDLCVRGWRTAKRAGMPSTRGR